MVTCGGSLDLLKSALEIGSVGLVIVGVSPGKLHGLLSSELRTQLGRDFLGDVLPNLQNIFEASFVLSSPQLTVIFSIHELRSN